MTMTEEEKDVLTTALDHYAKHCWQVRNYRHVKAQHEVAAEFEKRERIARILERRFLEEP